MALNFDTEYRKLNPEQRRAVDTIDGPVMVIAGAGTGKTQTISLRIAQILRKTDTRPSSVLCLTYTDVAAANMRSRLLTLIGPDANRVRIGTFHSFCNDVINSRPEFFTFAANLRPLDDLDGIEVIRSLIDNLPDNSPLITWGDRYFYQQSIIDNLRQVKRENISADILAKLIKEQSEFITGVENLVARLSAIRATRNNYPALESLFDELIASGALSPFLKSHLTVIRSSSNNLSEVKTKIIRLYQDVSKNIPKQQEFVKIYKSYQSALQKRGLYDFEDMILFVVEAFRANPDLLLAYQERFQYILVDEYQDTNSSQNTILDLLGSYFERPNIFVVGDDDQSIYRFQGASVENIYSFYQRYHPETIVLKNNYRSHRLILDVSRQIISHNKNRIAALISDIDKTLTSAVDYDPTPVNLIVAPTAVNEDYFLAQKITELIDSGENPGEIAVLFRKNSDPLELSKMFSAFNISYTLPGSTDILKNPLINHLLMLMEAVVDPKNDEALYHLLAAPFIGFNPLDLTLLTLKTRRLSRVVFDTKKISLLPISEKSQKKLRRLALRIARTRVDLQNYPPQNVLNRILRRFKILKFLIAKNDITTLSHLHTLSEHLRTTLDVRHLDLPQYLNRLWLYHDNHLPINSVDVSDHKSGSVRLLTVHGAKGLEFNHVFIYRLLADSWENQKVITKLKLPLGIFASEVTKALEDDYEEDRRLFYVALTRAKKQIYLSYSQVKDNGKALNPSIFISEIDDSLVEPITVNASAAALQKYYASASVRDPLKPELSDFLRSFLKNDYRFNVTHLNAYLKCPACFFYKTILKIPYNKDKAASFGTAVHAALASLYLHHGSREEVVEVFVKALKNEHLGKSDYRWCLNKGREVIAGYYAQYSAILKGNYLSEYNFYHDNLVLDGIPLTGRVDIVDKTDPGHVGLIDFKTGNPDSRSREFSPDGDYFRQLVFYRLLLDLKNDPSFRFGYGLIDFVEKSKIKNTYIRREIPVTTDDVANLVAKIKEVYQKILNLEFFEVNPLCPDRSHLHYLLKKL